MENRYNRYKEDYNDMYAYWEEKDPNIATKIKNLLNNELSIIDDLKIKLDTLNKLKKSNESNSKKDFGFNDRDYLINGIKEIE